jgi:hypothetical protein
MKITTAISTLIATRKVRGASWSSANRHQRLLVYWWRTWR